MTIDETIKSIRACMDTMNSRYGGVVFDEWAVVSLIDQKARILAYHGPRNDVFLQNFANDLGSLRASLRDDKFNPGDFEFAREAAGTSYEAFMVLAMGIYLICNHTKSTMNEIAANPKWLNAQVPFAELGEKVRGNALAVAV